MRVDGTTRALTRNLKSHDRELFAARNKQDIVCVWRKSRRLQGPYEVDGFSFYNLADAPEYVFALTDNWTTSGSPVPWGSEVVLQRLRAIDLWNHESYLDEVDAANEAVDKSRRKDVSNNIEAFMYDFRREFAKATNDINTSTMDMSEQKRRKKDGYREQNERRK